MDKRGLCKSFRFAIGPRTSRVTVFTVRRIKATTRLKPGVIPNMPDEIMYRPSVMPSEPGVMFMKTAKTVMVARYSALRMVISWFSPKKMA